MIIQKTISVFVVICLAISVAWCVEFDFVDGTNADKCVTSFSESFGHSQNSSNNSQDSHSNNCLCACHIPAIVYVFSGSLSTLQPESNTVIISISISAAPIQSIYHPPKV